MTARRCRLDIYAHCTSTVLMSRKPYTVVLVWYGAHDAVGVAKCRPTDKWSPAAGIARAENRAVRELAERIMAEPEAKNA